MKDANPKVSMIIPAKDHREYLRRLLESLRSLLPPDVPVEILVVDDGSAVELAPLVESCGGRCVRVEQSQGPAAARNLGASLSKGEYLFFLDADVEYAQGVLEKALDLFESYPEVEAVSFTNQRYDPRDGMVKNFGAAIEHYWILEILRGSAGDFGPTYGLATRNGIVSRKAFDAVGGFDTSFRTNAHEDYDFGKRLSARFPVLQVASPVLYHNFPSSLGRLLRNLWVRVTLFMPYFLKHRPRLDKAQTSSSEAVLRLVGTGSLACLALSALPLPGFRLWLIPGLIGMAGYVWSIRGFLAAARRWSGSGLFALQSFLLHLLTSVVITAGSGWGTLQYLLGRSVPPLKSPLQ